MSFVENVSILGCYDSDLVETTLQHRVSFEQCDLTFLAVFTVQCVIQWNYKLLNFSHIFMPCIYCLLSLNQSVN